MVGGGGGGVASYSYIWGLDEGVLEQSKWLSMGACHSSYNVGVLSLHPRTLLRRPSDLAPKASETSCSWPVAA